MGFLSRAGRDADNGIRATALVVEADAPPQGAPPFGRGSHGTVRILVDNGSGAASLSATFKHREDRWLVPGMEVAVTIDPARPDRFEVDWEAVPSMEDRVAANDPTLADPIGAGRRVAEALGLTQAGTGSARSERFNEAMEKAAQTPAPAGTRRAVVVVATIRGRFWSEEHGRHGVTIERNSAAVLAVNVPGRGPYAVLARKFKFPHLQADVTGAGLPALVSESDPNDVEVLWDEVPSLGSQLGTRISDSSADAQARTSQATAMQEQITGALGQADTGSQGAIPASGAAALGALAPQMQQLAADNAKRTLQFVQDPAQRRMLIEQYRAAGIVLDEGDEKS
jgi:hypothetical protein